MSRQLKQLRKELSRVYMLMSMDVKNPLEFEALYQRSLQLEKRIQQLQKEEYDMVGHCKDLE